MNGGALSASTPPPAAHGVPVSRPPVRLALLNEHGLPAGCLRRWLDGHTPHFVLVAVEEDWSALVRHPAFPSDAVILDADPKGPVSLAARVRIARAAGSVVLLIADAEAAPEVRSLPVDEIIARRSSWDELDEICERVREAVLATADRRSFAAAPRPRLSNAELQALRLYTRGATTAQVAEEMGVGYETVKTYLRRVRAKYAKLGRPASRRRELIQRAAEDGVLV